VYDVPYPDFGRAAEYERQELDLGSAGLSIRTFWEITEWERRGDWSS